MASKYDSPVKITDETHRRVKVYAARIGKPMGEVSDEILSFAMDNVDARDSSVRSEERTTVGGS